MAADPRAVLLRDIFDDPDDDLPRLVLGDYLADHGAPRGEFLQIDVRLAGRVKDRQERERLQTRRRELLARNALRWLGPLVDLASGWEFRRGFVSLTVRAIKLLAPEARGALLGPEFGWVEGVRVLEFDARPLCAAGVVTLLAGLPSLDLADSRLGNDGLEYLLASLDPNGVRHLDLSGTRVGVRGVSRAAACPYLRDLLSLSLRGNDIGEAGAVALIESPELDRLRRLDLRGCPLLHETRDELRHRFGERVRLDRA